MAINHDYHPGKNILNAEIRMLKHAENLLLLEKFGMGSIPEEKWYYRLLCFFRIIKRPPVLVHPSFKGGETVKFRRMKPFKSTPIIPESYERGDLTGMGTVRDMVKCMREANLKEMEMYWSEDGEKINIEVQITNIE